MKRNGLLLVTCLTLTSVPLVFAQDDRPVIDIWFHTSGSSPIVEQQVLDFNEAQDQFRAEVIQIPSGAGSSYNDAVNAAAVAGDLPCVIDLDGPNIYNYAWSGYLEPLDSYLPEGYLDDFLPTIVEQGLYNDQLFAIGASESNIGLVTTRPVLDAIGARIPTGIEDPWTLEEFNTYLEAAQNLEGFEYALDTKMNFGVGEWFTYAFSPIVQSFGGDLIDRETYLTAEGVLNGPESVAAMTWLQNLFTEGFATLTPADNFDFINGRAAMGIFVNWMYNGYKEAFGDDLVILPMPDFGQGAVTGMGSWAWAMTSTCEHKDGAWALMEYLLAPEQMDFWTAQIGSLPARRSVIAMQDRWAEGGDMHILIQQLEGGVARPRPITPAYPTITSAFSTAMDNIIKGADVQDELDAAVDRIDSVIEENDGFPVSS
jgi:multiple sugar transport system substrate-binding protein